VLNRTATFVFFIGERHFGALTAYVPGPAAADYRFTSALPAQILKSMAPLVAQAITSPTRCGAKAAAAVPGAAAATGVVAAAGAVAAAAAAGAPRTIAVPESSLATTE